MESREIAKNIALQKLQAWDKQAVAEVIEFRGETTVVVPANSWYATAEYLVSEPSLAISRFFPISPGSTGSRWSRASS